MIGAYHLIAVFWLPQTELTSARNYFGQGEKVGTLHKVRIYEDENSNLKSHIYDGSENNALQFLS